MTVEVGLVDLAAQQRLLSGPMTRAIERVLEHGRYIMGPEVFELEEQLAAYCGVRHAVTCSSGTDALLIALLAFGAKPGDAILLPSFTFAATAEVVALVGATPVFVDIHPSGFNIDPVDASRALSEATQAGLRPVGIIAVDLFGLPADYMPLTDLARATGLWVLADAAQSFGAALGSRRVGTLADVTATSFFPSKPLGCYGDGGAVFTDDGDLAAKFRSLRVHGQGRDKYENISIGVNARLDTLQAAILLQKMTVFDDELCARAQVAARYGEELGGPVELPVLPSGSTSAWAQYTVRVAGREDLAAQLSLAGVQTAVYYRRPLHRQEVYRDCGVVRRDLPNTDAAARSVLSLPMHPYLSRTQQGRVVRAVTTWVEEPQRR